MTSYSKDNTRKIPSNSQDNPRKIPSNSLDDTKKMPRNSQGNTRKIPRNSLKCSPNFFSTGNTRDGGRNVWEKRPLEERLVIYWAAGTLNMFTLYETLKTGVDMEMVSEASGRYVDYFRSYDALPVETEYIFHSWLPHNILTEGTSLDLQCTGCRKLFAREEFNEDSIRSEIQKCRVCRWIFHNGGEFCKKN